MKVLVEACWSGSDSYSFRLTVPGKSRITVDAGECPTWTRGSASDCLDAIEQEWGVGRRNVRFV